MARILTCGFEDGSIGGSGFQYASGVVASSLQKRTGSYSAYIDNVSDIVSFTLPVARQELYVRFGVYPVGSSGGNYRLMGMFSFSGGGARHLTFGAWYGTRQLQVYRGRGDTTLLAAGGFLADAGWNCVELYVKIANSSGRFVCKLNGAITIDYTGDTCNTELESVEAIDISHSWGAENLILTGYYDDIAINDTTGSVNNSWIGQGGVYLCPISGAGTVTGMTPSAGSNYACVDEVPASDTDYVSSADVADIDLYTIDTSALPTPIRVDAVKLGYRAKVDAGGANLVPVLRSESTTEEQTDDALAMSTSYTVQSVDYDVDPIDDAAWDATKLAALEVGQRKGL